MSIKTRLSDLLHYMRGRQLSIREHLSQAENDNTGTEANWPGANYYNQACIYALSGKSPAAIEALGEALRLEPQLIEWSKQDSDLASLRDEPGYMALYS